MTEKRPPPPAADHPPDEPLADPPAAAASERPLDEPLADSPAAAATATERPLGRLDELLADPPAAAATERPLGRLDELLADPPDHRPVGALTGYRDGARLRRRVLAVFVLVVVAAVWGARRYLDWLQDQYRVPPAEYQLAAGAEDESRPDALVWTEGVARLGITRQDPGVKAIVLPDRVLTLAPGCDHAQVKVEVQDGKTILLKVLVGEIRETPLAAESGPSSPGASKRE